jgi:hypothetical protein
MMVHYDLHVPCSKPVNKYMMYNIQVNETAKCLMHHVPFNSGFNLFPGICYKIYLADKHYLIKQITRFIIRFNSLLISNINIL